MDENKVRLDDLFGNPNVKLNITSSEDTTEREARLKREDAAATHERFKEKTLYFLTVSTIAAAFSVCAYMVLSKGFNPDGERWATATLTAILTGLVGYVTGRASK